MIEEQNSLSAEEIKQLAMDICEGQVFTSQQCESEMEVRMCFPVLLFVARPKKSKDETQHQYVERIRSYNRTMKLLENAGMVYEYYSKAGPMAINGKPIFFSCKIFPKASMNELTLEVNKYQELRKGFLDQAPEAKG